MRRLSAKNTDCQVSKKRKRDLLVTEDFSWLGEIHKVLSPYWSARSGYQGAWDSPHDEGPVHKS